MRQRKCGGEKYCKNPRDPVARNNLALAYFQLGRQGEGVGLRAIGVSYFSQQRPLSHGTPEYLPNLRISWMER